MVSFCLNLVYGTLVNQNVGFHAESFPANVTLKGQFVLVDQVNMLSSSFITIVSVFTEGTAKGWRTLLLRLGSNLSQWQQLVGML